VSPERLRIEWISAGEGNRFAEVMDDFVKKLRELGPLGRAEGLDAGGLKLKLEAANRLIPYIKLVERERLRVPVRSEEAYRAFYAGGEADRLFHDLIADKLAMSQIMLLLREKPMSAGEISGILGLSPSEVSRHMNISSRQGMVRYDSGSKCYAPA
jgi:F420-non-reducing hydrogenase iron-sulfur subunit